MNPKFVESQEIALGSEVKASCRRKHVSKMREIKVGIKRLDKLMKSLLNLQTAIKVMINENPNIEEVILALGASPVRPQHIFVLNFPPGLAVSKVEDDFARSKVAEGLSRKVHYLFFVDVFEIKMLCERKENGRLRFVFSLTGYSEFYFKGCWVCDLSW